MTGADHYTKAEELLRLADHIVKTKAKTNRLDPQDVASAELACAQALIHATLAGAAVAARVAGLTGYGAPPPRPASVDPYPPR